MGMPRRDEASGKESVRPGLEIGWEGRDIWLEINVNAFLLTSGLADSFPGRTPVRIELPTFSP
jgi:hypothetical protein